VSLFSFEMASNIEIAAPRGHVFSFVEMAKDWPKWSGVVVDVKAAPSIPWGVAEALSFRLRMAGRSIPFSVRVTDYQPGSRIAWRSTKLTITAVRTLTFVGDESCRVTDHKRFCSPVVPIGIYYPRSIIRNMTDRWLADLKRVAEERAPYT